MYHLATVAPTVRRIRIPVSRDQAMLLMAAINEIFLGVDIYLAHSISGTIRPNEWIPIIFGPIAGALLIVAGLIAIRYRMLATLFASFVLVGSIVVGLLGAYFHLIRAALPTGPEGEQITIRLVVWGPPILGPLMFAMVGLLGISAAWVENPPDSGRLRLWGNTYLPMPLSKTRAYFLITSLGILMTLLSSVLDHGRTEFRNPYLWIPTVGGVFGVFVALMLGLLERPSRSDLTIYTVAMLLLILIGVIGFGLHVNDDLTTRYEFVKERFIRGAPVLAPLLFANLGTIGLIVLMDPRSETLKDE
jgi:hypothetical protein